MPALKDNTNSANERSTGKDARDVRRFDTQARAEMELSSEAGCVQVPPRFPSRWRHREDFVEPHTTVPHIVTRSGNSFCLNESPPPPLSTSLSQTPLPARRFCTEEFTCANDHSGSAFYVRAAEPHLRYVTNESFLGDRSSATSQQLLYQTRG